MDHLYRIADQMLTMHSVLRDRNHRRALFIDLLILGISMLLVAAVFADEQILTLVGISEDFSKYVIGFSSLGVFFLSLVTLRIDWKQQSARHQDAHLKLAALKAKFQEWKGESVPDETERTRELMKEYGLVMKAIPPIPESKFNGLKAIHLRKVELSKALSHNPGASARLLSLRIVVVSSFRALKRKQL